MVRVIARRRDGLHPRRRDRGRPRAGGRRARARRAAPTGAPPPPGRSPPRSPRAPRSRSRCTRTARAGTSATLEVGGRDGVRQPGVPSTFAVTLHLPAASARSRASGCGDRRQVPGPPGAHRPRGDRDRPGRAVSGSTRRLMDLGLRAGRARSPAPAAGSAARSARLPLRRGRQRAAGRARRRRSGRGGSRVRRGGRGRRAACALDVTEPDAGERMRRRATERFGGLDVLVNNAGTARRRELDEVPDEEWQAAWELNVMAPLRAMRAAVPGMADRGWGRVVNVCSPPAKRPSALMPEYSVAKAAELSLSRLFADRYAEPGRAGQRDLPRARRSRSCGWSPAACSTSRPSSAATSPRGGARGGGGRPADRPPRRGRGDRRRDRLPLLGAGLLRGRRRLERRRRHRAGDHLIASSPPAARSPQTGRGHCLGCANPSPAGKG